MNLGSTCSSIDKSNLETDKQIESIHDNKDNWVTAIGCLKACATHTTDNHSNPCNIVSFENKYFHKQNRFRQRMASPDEILDVQTKASGRHLLICAAVRFFKPCWVSIADHLWIQFECFFWTLAEVRMGSGDVPAWYGKWLLPELHWPRLAWTHQPKLSDGLSQWFTGGRNIDWSHPLMSSDWSHFVALQANWFVSVSPLAFCLGVLLSIVASERLGRSRIVKIWCQFFSLKFVFWYYFRKMMFVLSNSIPLLCFVLLYFAPNFAIMLGKIKSKLNLCKYSNLSLAIMLGKIKSKNMNLQIFQSNLCNDSR